MRSSVGAIAAFATLAVCGHAVAAPDCEAGADALGVSRVLEIDTAGGPLLGTLQYADTVPLGPREVVLTFDDGPHPRNTLPILDALDAECVKATFFPVGVWARHVPKVLREVAERGHTIGNHTWSHPNLTRLTQAAAEREIEKGFAAIAEATGAPPAPFVRYPGLNDSAELNAYAAANDYAVFSCDIGTDDWRGIDARSIVGRTLARLERRGGGVVLFHDSKATTAAAIPVFLRELKRRGFEIVHLVPKRPVPSDALAELPAATPRAVVPAQRATR